MKRIGIAQIKQETNTFNPIRTDLPAFESFGYGIGDEVITKFGDVNEIGGFLDGLRRWDEPATPIGIIRAQASPGGKLGADTLNRFIDVLGSQLSPSSRSGEGGAAIANGTGEFDRYELDGLLVSLHGAMVAENENDPDGLFLETIRKCVGTDVPVVVALDLHAKITRRMLDNADIIVGFQTSPHIDIRETGLRAAALLERVFAGLKPTYFMKRLPMISMSENQITAGPALKPVFDRLRELEADEGYASCSLFMTQPWLDIPDLGWSVLLYTDFSERSYTQPDGAADEIASMCWSRKEMLDVELTPPEQCIRIAAESPDAPVVVSESADATNSGGGGDSTNLLRLLVQAELPGGALTILVDPDTVAHARKIGEGGKLGCAVGGKRDTLFSKPLRIEGRVEKIKEATFTLTGHGGHNLPIDMGMSATVCAGDTTIVFVEYPGPGGTPDMYRCVELEPKDFKLVVVKSPAGFRADFGKFAAKILIADTPGIASGVFSRFSFENISRPLWPLDSIDKPADASWTFTLEPIGPRT